MLVLGWESIMRNELVVAVLGIVLVGCAGRDPQPIVTVQQQDVYADCTMIRAEIEANNIKVKELADEQGLKVAQNVAAGVAGLVIWPIWFGMDFKGAAGKDAAALQARQQYLAVLATQRCAPPPATAQRQASPARQKTARAPARAAVPPPTMAPVVTEEPEPVLPPTPEIPH
jgi:hypothetical protein